MGKKSYEEFQKALAWTRAHIGQHGIAWSDGPIHKIGFQIYTLAWPLENGRIGQGAYASGATWQEAVEKCITKHPELEIPIEKRPVFEAHENVVPPERRDLTIRRYMSVDSFELLVTNQAIRFGRLDTFDDKREGASTSANAKARIKQYAHTHFKGDFGNPQAYANALAADRERSRRQYFISCWDTNPIESATMWGSYAPQGIAIESTVDRFETSLTNRYEQPIRFGMVNYLDFDTEIIDESNMMNIVYSKTLFWQDERELRAVLWLPPWKDGKPDFHLTEQVRSQIVPVNLSNLITKVIVSGSVLENKMENIQSLCASAGLPNPVPSISLRKPEF
jgi:hypothetical protein